MAKDMVMRLVNGSPSSVATADNIEDWTNAVSAVALGDAVYITGTGTVAKALADGTITSRVIGLVWAITDTTHCRVLTHGQFESYSTGMTLGSIYYLSASGAGTLSLTSSANPVAIAVSTTDVYVCVSPYPAGSGAGDMTEAEYNTLAVTGQVDKSNAVTLTGTAGENLVAGDLVYLKSDGKWWKARGNAATTIGLLALATSSITADIAGLILRQGPVTLGSWSWSIGGTAGILYVSTATAGVFQQTVPTTGTFAQVCGYATSTTSIYFDPSVDYFEVS